MQQEVSPQIAPTFLTLVLLVSIVVALVYLLQKRVQKWTRQVDDPFTEGERSVISYMKKRMPGRRVLAGIFLVIIVISTIVVTGLIPAHRENIRHTDPVGDVSDPNVDIVEIRSYLNETAVFLEMTVHGQIIGMSPIAEYRYQFLIVATFLDDHSTHVYRFSYQNGSLSEPILREHIDNDTLTLIVPLSRLLPDAFIIGLESSADMGLEQDLTSPDRGRPVASMLTNFLGI